MTPETMSTLLQGAEILAVVVAGFFAYLAYRASLKIHLEQIDHSRRQAFMHLAERMDNIHFVNRKDLNWREIHSSINLLELAAVLYTHNAVDRKMLLEAYSLLYTRVFEQIFAARDSEQIDYRGDELLREFAPTAIRFYEQLCVNKERQAVTKTTPKFKEMQ